MKWLALVGAAWLGLASGTAFAGEKAIRIGILNDQSGMAADIGGAGAVVAARLAVEDFGRTVLGKPIEIQFADHQNKPDIAATIARKWFDTESVDIVLDLANSSVALAVFTIAAERNKIAVSSSGLSSQLTGKSCTKTSFLFATDTYALAQGLATAIVAAGGDTWYFLNADYAFGNSLRADATDAIEKGGGKVIGRVMHPFNATDFSSPLLSAQASGAKVIGLANGAGDTINSLKQAHEFGMLTGGKQKLAALLLYITDIHSTGLEIAQKTQLINTFYWDRDDASRTWSRRFMEKMGGRAPAQTQAAIYSGVLHYLKAVKSSGSDDGTVVAEEMRKLPVEDFYSKGAAVRKDGRVVRDHFLYEVKSPEESKYAFDYLKPISVVPGEKLVRPLAESECPFARQP